MRAGVTRLMRLALKEQMKQLEKNLRGFEQAALQLRNVVGADELREICSRDHRPLSSARMSCAHAEEYEAQIKRARTRLPAVSEAACRLFAAIAAEYHNVSLKLGGSGGRWRAPPPISARSCRTWCAAIYQRHAVGAALAPAALPQGDAAAPGKICARSRARREARAKHSRAVETLRRTPGPAEKNRRRRFAAG